MIAANNGHLLAFDNFSGLPAAGSPMHSAGQRAGTVSRLRRRYSDDEEVLIKAQRQAPRDEWDSAEVIGRPDLADRAIFLTLSPIG